MNLERIGLRPIGLVVCAVLAILTFLTGTVFGTVVLGWWIWPSPFASPTPTAPLGTPQPTGVSLATPTLPTGTPPARVPGLTVTLTPCAPLPGGWLPYLVKSGDTLSELAFLSGVSQEQIMQINCLESPELWAGQVLYLPPLRTPTPCGLQPVDWVPYTVKPGDTLSALADLTGTSLERVMQANCLASLDLWAGQVLYLPPLPTPSPTPCVPSPPPGWVLNVVQPGDTLPDLAALHGTTIEEIMAVNCLLSSQIVAGQGLYLPSLPTPPEAAPPSIAPEPAPQPVPPQPAPQPPTPEAVASRLDIPDGELPELKIPFGSPNEFEPCETGTGPRISAVTPSDELWERGERIFLYACDFDLDTLTAQMVGPPPYDDPQAFDGLLRQYPYPLAPELRLLDPDLDRLHRDLTRGEGRAQAAVVWGAACNLPPGDYTVTLRDGPGQSDEYIVKLGPREEEDTERILTLPQFGAAGSSFDIYYCNYPPNGPVTVGIYYDFGREYNRFGVLQNVAFRRLRTWQVPINSEGWAMEEIETFPHNSRGLYLLRAEDREGVDRFWLGY